jgi:hypothetical protein
MSSLGGGTTTTRTVVLKVSGEKNVVFEKLAQATNEISNPLGVLAGRRAQQIGVVNLQNAPWDIQSMLWLEAWYQSALQKKPGSHMSFEVDVLDGKTVKATCSGRGVPTKFVLGTVSAGGISSQYLVQLTLRCPSLDVVYF